VRKEPTDIYPFGGEGRYIYAWVFRRDEYGRPVLRSIRLRRYRKDKMILIVRKRKPDA